MNLSPGVLRFAHQPPVSGNRGAGPVETLVMYYSSAGAYGIRLRPGRSGDSHSSANLPAIPPKVARGSVAISDAEYEELTYLRKAQAWGAPLFQPGHRNYAQALARLSELQAKERATA
jgi:hypothetical protein